MKGAISQAIFLFVVVDSVKCQDIIIQPASTWLGARQACRTIGRDLVMIKDNIMWDAVSNCIRIMAPSVPAFWMGLQYKPMTQKFYWVDSNELGSFNAWSSNEPNYMTNSCGDCCQDCVRIENFSWKTRQCDHLYHGICVNVSSSLPLTCPQTTTTKMITTEESTMVTRPIQTSNTDSAQTSTTNPAQTSTTDPTLISSTNPEEIATTAPADISTTAPAQTSTTAPAQTSTTAPAQTSTTAPAQTSSTNPAQKGTSISIPISKDGSTQQSLTSTTDWSNTTKEKLHVSTSLSTTGDSQMTTSKMTAGKSNTADPTIDNLKIDKKKTGAYIRAHTSAYDGRFSSKVIGLTGAAVIIGVVLTIILIDATRIIGYANMN